MPLTYLNKQFDLPTPASPVSMTKYMKVKITYSYRNDQSVKYQNAIYAGP